MRMRTALAVIALIALIAGGGLTAAADSGRKFYANLTGFDEVPTLSVAGTGTFTAELAKDGQSISYSLNYSGLTGDASFAHIHLGQPAIAGGVIVFLCGGGGKPTCPGAAGTVSDTITAADVVGPDGQGIAAREFVELVTAMQVGATYVNVHTALFPTGEIRGQIS